MEIQFQVPNGGAQKTQSPSDRYFPIGVYDAGNSES